MGNSPDIASPFREGEGEDRLEVTSLSSQHHPRVTREMEDSVCTDGKSSHPPRQQPDESVAPHDFVVRDGRKVPVLRPPEGNRGSQDKTISDRAQEKSVGIEGPPLPKDRAPRIITTAPCKESESSEKFANGQERKRKDSTASKSTSAVYRSFFSLFR